MDLVKFQPRAGVARDMTDYAGTGGWRECDKVRFRNGFPESIGGWTPALDAPLPGICRAMHGWVALNGTTYIGLGTESAYYAYESGSIRDITPVRYSGLLDPDPMETTAGSNVVTVTHAGHGALEGDRVVISDASSFNGIPADLLNGEHTIKSVPTANTYTFEVDAIATGSSGGSWAMLPGQVWGWGAETVTSGKGGGSAVFAEYLVSPGFADTTTGTGWGAGKWSREGWSEPSTDTVIGAKMRMWSQDNFGEDLVMCLREGPIAYWDVSTATRATYLTNMGGTEVPVAAYEVMVSDTDRHLIAFGTNNIGSEQIDPLLIRWSSAEDATDWLPTSTNSAGDLRLGFGSRIVTARQSRAEILVWTDTSLHSMTYVGAPFIFGIQTLASSVDIIGPKAKAAVNDVVYWMGNRSFYIYTGRVETLPCPLLDHVFGNLNLIQKDKAFAATNTAFNEVTFFYPSAGSVEVDSYVTYNYLAQVWTYGTLPRTAWLDRGLTDYPMAMGTDGYLYYHEYGTDDGSTNPPSAINSYIASSPIEVPDGEHFAFINRMIPDVTFWGSAPNPSVDITLTPRDYPGGPLVTSDGGTVVRSTTVPVEQFTRQVQLRLRGRSVALKIASNQVGVGWRLGVPRFEVRVDGRR